MHHDHGDTKIWLATRKNSLPDTMSKVKHYVDENSALMNTLYVRHQETLS
jgi:hypothetical protein